MNETPPNFEALLMGVNFRPIEAKAIVLKLQEGDALILQREPLNAYDGNAVQVLAPDDNEVEPNCFLGYVAKEIASDLAPWMDQGWHFTCTTGMRMSETKVVLNIEPILPTASEEKVPANADAD